MKKSRSCTTKTTHTYKKHLRGSKVNNKLTCHCSRQALIVPLLSLYVKTMMEAVHHTLHLVFLRKR